MLDPEEEQQYTELRRLAQKLHIPIPEAFIELEVRDKEGNVIQRHRQRSHSWTRNAYNTMFSQLAAKDPDVATYGAGELGNKDTAGVVRSANWAWGISGSADGTLYDYRAPAGDYTKGILVGSGTNAESFEDYVLQTPIAHGTGAGQLSHIESEAHAVTYADTTLTNTLVRYFNNNSGGNVLVNEVALVAKWRATPYAWPFCLSRDKLASTVTVPDTGQLKVTYTVSLTYPS